MTPPGSRDALRCAVPGKIKCTALSCSIARDSLGSSWTYVGVRGKWGRLSGVGPNTARKSNPTQYGGALLSNRVLYHRAGAALLDVLYAGFPLVLVLVATRGCARSRVRWSLRSSGSTWTGGEGQLTVTVGTREQRRHQETGAMPCDWRRLQGDVSSEVVALKMRITWPDAKSWRLERESNHRPALCD
jgi:hypothetical protein